MAVSTVIEALFKLDPRAAIAGLRQTATAAEDAADAIDSATEATERAGEAAEDAAAETQSWTEATDEQAGALDAMKGSAEWIIAFPAAVFALVGAFAALTTEVRAAQQEVRRAAEAAGLAEAEVLAIREAAQIAGVELGDLRESFDALGDDGQASVRKLGDELASAQQKTGEAADKAREWAATLATVQDKVTGIGSAIAEAAQGPLRGLALGSAAVLSGGTELARQQLQGPQDPRAVLAAVYAAALQGGAGIVAGEQGRLAAAAAVEGASQPFFGPAPLEIADIQARAAEEQAARDEAQAAADARAAEEQAARDAEQARLLGEIAAAIVSEDARTAAAIAAQQARGERGAAVREEQAAFMRALQEQAIATRAAASEEAQALQQSIIDAGLARRASALGQAQAGLGAAGSVLGGDGLSLLGLAGPYGALAAQGAGALSGLGVAGGSETAKGIASQVSSIADGLAELPDLLTELIPALMTALGRDFLPALIQTLIGPELQIAIYKGVFEGLKAIFTEVIPGIAKGFRDAFLSIWETIRDALRDIFRIGGRGDDPRDVALSRARRAEQRRERNGGRQIEFGGSDLGRDLIRFINRTQRINSGGG